MPAKSLIVMSIVLLGTCTAWSEEVNPVVGKTGDYVLRETDLERVIGYQSPEALQTVQSDPVKRSEVVRQLLLTKAVAARSRKEGFDKKTDIKEQLSYVIDNFIAQEYIRKVVVANVAVPEEEVKKYYTEHEKDFLLPLTAKVRHIFFQLPENASAEAREKTRAKAEAVLKQLDDGADFAALARSSSEDGDSAPKGGELGSLSPGKTNSDVFEKAAFSLKAGEISRVVETPFGYHIIKVDERTEQRTPRFEEVKEYLNKIVRAEFEQKKAQEFLENVAKEAGLEVVQAKPAEDGLTPRK